MKTKRPVAFEITPKTKDALSEWIKQKNLCSLDYLFPSSYRNKGHLEPRHYARLVKKWVGSIGLDSTAYGTHSMRRILGGPIAFSGTDETLREATPLFEEGHFMTTKPTPDCRNARFSQQYCQPRL